LSVNEGRNSFSANQRRNSFADSTTTEGFQKRDKDIENFLADSASSYFKLTLTGFLYKKISTLKKTARRGLFMLNLSLNRKEIC
jgi:hypothetical protein